MQELVFQVITQRVKQLPVKHEALFFLGFVVYCPVNVVKHQIFLRFEWEEFFLSLA